MSREKMLLLLPAIYGVLSFIFSLCMMWAQAVPREVVEGSRLYLLAIETLGFVFYLFVESFGSLMIASLFWAFASDSTDPASAKKGFPLVYAIGQAGGIVIPYTVGGLPHRMGFETDAVSLAILGSCTLLIIPCVKLFLKQTPAYLLSSYEGGQGTSCEDASQGFFEGLRLLRTHRYLLGIFAVNCIYEIIVTIFDFNFKVAAGTKYSGVALSHYLSIYASSVNIVSLLCLLFGISNVTRFLGVGAALAAMPIIVGGALFGFLTFDSLPFLFSVMVGAKAINYALNGPALKQLYIPTTHDVRFNAQAWIETFGSRASKELGSLFNMTLGLFQHCFGEVIGKSYYLFLSGGFGFPLLGAWFITAIFLGGTFRKAIRNKTVVC